MRFLVRDVDGVIDGKTLSALNLARLNLRNFQARSLNKLHSKVIIIDDKIFYLGSANWYWYSLNKGVEVTIKGRAEVIPDLISLVNKYWNESSPVDLSNVTDLDCKPVKGDHHYL